MKEFFNQSINYEAEKGGAGGGKKAKEKKFTTHTEMMTRNNPTVPEHKSDSSLSFLGGYGEGNHDTPSVLKEIKETIEVQKAVKENLAPAN